MENVIMESQANRNKVLERLKYDPKTQTIDTRVKDVKTGKNIRIKLEIRDTKNEVYLDLTDSHDAIDFYDFINKSKIVIKRKFLNMRNNSAIGMIFHEIGHLIDIIDSKFKNHLSDKDQITMKRLKEYVHKNLNTASLSEHDAHEREHIADGFGATKTSYHTMNKSISKNTKGDKNKIYSVYKKLLVDYGKLSNRIKQLNLPPENELVEEIQEMNTRLAKLEFPDNFWDDDYDPEEEALNFEKVKEIEDLKFEIEKKFNLYKNYLNKNALEKSLKVTYPNDKIHKQRGPAERSRMTRNSSDYASNINESCLIMDNDEFFMEASKNPAVKARRRTVNNLRRLGVDRAHEVDNKKLEEGIDVNIKDSYGNNHKVKFTSTDKDTNSYHPAKDIINITPETMNRSRFDAVFNHEAGHVEQHRRFGLTGDTNRTDYTISNKDDYPIKCAKLFLQKNKSKMNDHDNQWTELHADFLSCKKSGFGKAIKMVHTFRKSTNVIASLINECEKEHEEDSNKIRNKYLKINDKEGNERVLSDAEVENIIASYKQTEEKLTKRENTLHERYINMRNKYDNLLDDFDLSEEYMKKFDKLLYKLRKIERDTYNKVRDLDVDFEKKHGVYVENLSKYKDEILDEMNDYLKELRSLKALTTTYDYRGKFIEDMYWIHKGYPGRCSMKYPPMTPADKKYMQEFTVEEMYLSNIITESEYIQLQERIQILTERSE